MTALFSDLALLLLAYATLWYLISLIIKRNDVADVAWGLGYVLVAAYCYLKVSQHPTALMVYALVTLWALRLSIYIGIRNSKKPEDFRYKQWREDWGNNFYWRSYLQVYVLQAAILLFISISIPMAALSEVGAGSIHWLSWVGAALWFTGFYWQTVGDYQMGQFRKNRSHKDEVMDRGLWKYSRHPNYFGEVLMWWAIFLIVLPLEYGPYAVISPVLITWLLLKVSGIPMLEEKYKGNEAYEAYKSETPALVPKFW